MFSCAFVFIYSYINAWFIIVRLVQQLEPMREAVTFFSAFRIQFYMCYRNRYLMQDECKMKYHSINFSVSADIPLAFCFLIGLGHFIAPCLLLQRQKACL